MFEAYKIAVTMSLTNHVSRGLALVAGDFAKTEEAAKAFEKRLDSIKNTALKGGLMIAAGGGMLAMFKGPLEEAKKFEQQVGKFKLFGMSDQQNVGAVRFAKSMNIIGTSARDAMKLVTEAQGVFRESGLAGSSALEGAKLAAPVLAKIDFASSSLDGESKAKMHAQGLAMLRFIEMRGGLNDAPTFNRTADAGWKAIQSSGGNVNWEQLRQFAARGGVSAQGLSDRALYGQLEPIIGELKGSTAGFALRTAYNRLTGSIRIPNQVAHLLTDSGLWDSHKVAWNSMGGIKSFKGNPLKDMELLSQSPIDFYAQKILPMYNRMNGGKGLSQAERNRENVLIFGSTGGAMFSLIDKQMAVINRSVDAWDKALGINKSADAAKNTLAGKEIALQKNWNDLLLALGETILPLAVSALGKLNPLLKDLSEWMHEHKSTVKAIALEFGALGAALVGFGSLALIAAGFNAISLAVTTLTGGAGVTLLGGALAGLAGPVSIAVAAIGTIAAALYAYRPLSKEEIENAGGTRTHLTSDAQARIRQNGGLHALDGDFKPYANVPARSGGSGGNVTHVHNYIDGKEISSHLIPHKSLGPSSFNQSAHAMPPGMNLGWSGN